MKKLLLTILFMGGLLFQPVTSHAFLIRGDEYGHDSRKESESFDHRDDGRFDQDAKYKENDRHGSNKDKKFQDKKHRDEDKDQKFSKKDHSDGDREDDFGRITYQIVTDGPNRPVITPTPEPMTMTLFGMGLVGLGLVRRKKLNNKMENGV